jgi:ATP-dependent Clp protease ATP-binding subunit ClpA
MQATREALRKRFKPEFLNRVDETVVFRSLNTADAGRILDKFVDQLRVRAEKQGMELVLDQSARTWLLDKGFSDSNGARELRRCMQRNLEAPMADALLTNEWPEGGRTEAYLTEDGVRFRSMAAPPRRRTGRRRCAESRSGKKRGARKKSRQRAVSS